MLPFRLRVLVADSPGSLGTVAEALQGIGVSILDVDVQSHDGELWTDELVVAPTVPIDPPAIEVVLRAVGVTVLDLHPTDLHEVVDTTARALELAGRLAAEHGGDRALGRATAGLVRADSWWLNLVGLPDHVARLTVPHGPASAAFASGVPEQGRTWSVLAPLPDVPRWTLALPFDADGHRRILLLRRRGPRFTDTEIARAQMMVRLAVQLRSRQPRPATGGPQR